jgi:hypothetical protein
LLDVIPELTSEEEDEYLPDFLEEEWREYYE